uniref:DUF559 domain-containing protein n=1 Tax=viral metagenome TaxID=1070528 RepID=A0A6M3L749_9ZZZZ
MDLLQLHCKALKLPIPEKEYRFAPPRRWRADYFFANDVSPLAVEIEGGLFSWGRHVRGKGAIADMAKYNQLSIMGISLLRFTPQQVEKGEAALMVKKWFEARQ